MASTYFAVEPADLLDYVNVTGEVGYVQFDNPSARGYISPLKAETIIGRNELMVLSQLPPKIARICRGQVDGVVAVEYASSGQDTATLPAVLVGNVETIKLYVNYPCAFKRLVMHGRQPKSYDQRTDQDALLTGYVFDNDDGSITLSTPLQAGDNLIVDVTTTSSEWVDEIKTLVIKAACADLLNALPSLNDKLMATAVKLSQDYYLYLLRLQGKSNDRLYVSVATIETLNLAEPIRDLNQIAYIGI